MLQLSNHTPFRPLLNVLPDRNGIDTLFVLVRASFTLTPSVLPADVQPAPSLTDEHYAEPQHSSLRYASDLHVGKPGTDVALLGCARAPAARPVESLLVALSVGSRRKLVSVHGDRSWAARGGFSAPLPFIELPLRWERAFGGSQRLPSGELFADERNPVGVGYRGTASSLELLGTPLPNLEDPRSPLSSPGDQATPAGFGFVARHWRPRRDFAGTYDDAWRRTRAPYLPADLDPRFFCAATPELVFTPALRGGEPVEVVGALHEGALCFNLPAWELRATARIAGRLEHRECQLETVVIEPDLNRLGLTFRAAFACDKQVLKVDRVVVEGRPRA